MLQAYLDESIEEDGVFVLGGYIATAESWAKFSAEWESLLQPFGTLRDDNKYHFKMKEMALTDDRMARVPIFLRVIDEHVLAHVSTTINVRDLAKARERIFVSGEGSGFGPVVSWDSFLNPYYMTFRLLMDMFHNNRSLMAEYFGDEKIDFYFDDRVEVKVIHEMWSEYMSFRSEEAKKYYGARPRFEDDTEFLPLQAADLWAWWVRKWHVEGTPEKIANRDFGRFVPAPLNETRKSLMLEISASEDELTKSLLNIGRAKFPNRLFRDRKFSYI